MKLKETFMALARQFADNQGRIEACWEELSILYSSDDRHYHTLNHLEQINGEIQGIKCHLLDVEPVLFALFYHDAVYNPLGKDNEEKSVELAEERLHSLKVPKPKIEACAEHILATKTHSISSNSDSNFFTDADLSILGMDSSAYGTYSRQIRQEYSAYSDVLYVAGRKAVLQRFLNMIHIFKTIPFREKYEHRARINLATELQSLNIL